VALFQTTKFVLILILLTICFKIDISFFIWVIIVSLFLQFILGHMTKIEMEID
jgi:hypothetical protein